MLVFELVICGGRLTSPHLPHHEEPALGVSPDPSLCLLPSCLLSVHLGHNIDCPSFGLLMVSPSGPWVPHRLVGGPVEARLCPEKAHVFWAEENHGAP